MAEDAHPYFPITNDLLFGVWLSDDDVYSEGGGHVSLRPHQNGLKH
jgi:hypothetical protein